MNEKILLVDDAESNLGLLAQWLVPLGYDVRYALNGKEAVRKTREEKPDLIILDIMMPVMDGYEACRILKNDVATKSIPIIMVTAQNDRKAKINGLSVSANDFLPKPIDQAELTIRVQNLLKIKAFDDFMLRHNQLLEEEVQERTKDLQNMSYEMVQKLTAAAEFRDTDTGAHIRRIGLYAGQMAGALNMPPDYIEMLTFASSLHDIGKIGIPDSILLKPDTLTRNEFETMKSHTAIGEKILSDSNFPDIQMAAAIALTHHERWDGSGYPRGLKGEETLLAGRIVMLADHYDALRCARPYKPAFDHAETFKIITQGDGRTIPEHFEPTLLNTFKKIAPGFADIFGQNP